MILTLLLFITRDPNQSNIYMPQNITGNNNQLSIACWNSRGLVTSLPYLHELLKSNDIVALSEHWLHANKLNSLTEISPDFDVIARSSKFADASDYGCKRGQGGVALFWRKSLGGVTPITTLKHDRFCGVRLQCDTGRIINIISVYMPSPGATEKLNETIDELAEAIDKMEVGSLSLVCGDYNGDVGYLGGLRSNRRPTAQGKNIMKFFDEFSLSPSNLNAKATGPLNTFRGGVGSSTIDYIAVPVSLLNDIVSCEVLVDPILNTSDHHAIRTVMGFSGINIVYTKSDNIPNIKWRKIPNEIVAEVYTGPVDMLCEDILRTTDFPNLDVEGLDSIIDLITSKMVEISETLPKARYRKHVRPYWNSTLSELKKEKVSAYRLWSDEGRPRDPLSPVWVNHKNAKRNFRRELRKVQREYEQKQINDLVVSAECDRTHFWKLVKNVRQPKQASTIAIRNRQGRVVQEMDEVVEAWRDHFSFLSRKKDSDKYDNEHYKMVTQKVKEWSTCQDQGTFMVDPLRHAEIRKAINKLNKGKATGCDGVSAEHLQFAGNKIIDVLTGIFQRVVTLEYVPTNFRLGTQIPLYKGKNTCTLDQNNYRGITLLTSLNKVFEILLWERVKGWWESEQVISPLQGACRTGKSCVHTALTLQESVSVGLGTKKKVLVTYLDVSKAFDGVWIDGLFYQLRQLGLEGITWRLLYLTYQNFKCKARVAGSYSDWYVMECGIHQGGFLSLLKYVAFIDPLLRNLERSEMGCRVGGVPSNPVGYADDMATANLSKASTDRSLGIISKHAKKWRYAYNAKKSAVLVFGETKREHTKGAKYRNFSLDGEKIPEKVEYDHLGIKNCLFQNSEPRTEDRISRGRRAFNAITSIGIHKKGITMSACSIIYWAIIVPIVTYGSEIWVLSSGEIEELRKFQRYVGRKCQRFPKRSPNYSAYMPLGWMSLDRVVQVKKLMFLRTILVMADDDICKRILSVRAEEFCNDLATGRINAFSSPIFDLLNTSIQVDLFNIVMRMIRTGCYFSKSEWRKLVWEKVWIMEDEDCIIMYKQPHQNYLLFNITDKPYFLVWWILAGLYPRRIRMCETMAALVCETGLLRSTDYRLKKKSFSYKICVRCEHGMIESIWHLVMQCPYFSEESGEIFKFLGGLNNEVADRVMNDPTEYFNILMGKQPDYASFDEMKQIWLMSGSVICRLYRRAISGR